MQIKQIVDTNYYITSDGDVLNKQMVKLKLRVTKTGYNDAGLKLISTSKYKWYRTHRLVAEYFIPNPENKPFVNHKDGDKLNNKLSNLEWVTHQENMDHAKIHGLIHYGENNKKSIHTEEQVENICKLLQMGYRNVDIAKSFNTSMENISMIRNGVCWRQISRKYNIPLKSRSLSCETIRWICLQIENGLTQGEIIKISDNPRITKTMIKDIRRKRIYVDISKNYNF